MKNCFGFGVVEFGVVLCVLVDCEVVFFGVGGLFEEVVVEMVCEDCEFVGDEICVMVEVEVECE